MGADQSRDNPVPERNTVIFDPPTTETEPADLLDLLRRAKPHLYAVDRKGWCWCDITVPGTPHNPDCKWIADVDEVGGLRVEIDAALAAERASGGLDVERLDRAWLAHYASPPPNRESQHDH